MSSHETSQSSKYTMVYEDKSHRPKIFHSHFFEYLFVDKDDTVLFAVPVNWVPEERTEAALEMLAVDPSIVGVILPSGKYKTLRETPPE